MQGSTATTADREIQMKKPRGIQRETSLQRGKEMKPKREGEDQKPRETEIDRNSLEESRVKKEKSSSGGRLKDFFFLL